MSISKKLLQSSAAAAAVCNSESIAPFGNEASYNKNVAIYQFEDDANDSSGNSNNGTAANVSYVTGKFGKAASFNGSSSTIEVDDPVVPNGATSISFWYNPNSSTGTEYILGSGVATASKGVTVYWYNQSFGALVTKGTSSLAGSATGSITYSTTAWHHVVFTWDGTSDSNAFKVYVNGALLVQGTSDTSSSSIGTYTTFAIGGLSANQSGSYTWAEGLVDQTRVYSKVLTAEEVTTLYVDETTSTASSTEIIKGTSCVAYYPLDYDASDKSGNFHGTATAVEFGEHGKINFAADFDGSTSYIQMADNIFQYSALSISLWFWGPPSTSGWNVLFNNSGYISGQRFLGYILACVNDRVIAYLSNTSIGSDATYTMSASYNIGAWNFIVATMDSTNQLKMYLNGASAESFTTGGYGFNNSYPMNVTIGTRKSGQDSCTSGCEWFPDRIDEVRVFNRILSSDEATTLYELTACSHTCTTDNQDFVATNASYYKLSGDADDYHGGTHNGTGNGITWGTGRFANAAIFDGSNDYLSHPSPYSNTANNEDLTISWWFNTDTTFASSGFYTMLGGDIANSSGNGGTVGINVYGHGTKIVYIAFTRIWGSNANYYPSGSTNSSHWATIEPNRWYHGAITYSPDTSSYSSSTSSFYLNGNKIYDLTMSTYTTSGNNTNGDLAWGQYRASSTFYDGKFDNIRFFDEVLTASNIRDLYDSEYQCYITKNASDPFGGSSEVAFFKFDNNLTDSTGSYAASASSVSYTTTAAFGTHSLSFNDTNNYIDFGTSGKIPVVSVSYWVKMNSAGHNTRDTLIYSEETSSTYFGCIRWGSNDVGTSWYAGGSAWTYSGTDWDLTGKWHHVYQDKDLNVYLNGLPINSGSAGGTSQNIRYIGQYPTGNSDYYMNGYLDHVRIFNTKLTGDQIWQLFVEGNG